MCLAVPAKLVEHNGDEGTADLHGNRVPVNTMLTEGVQVGDWILIHAGFAIQKLTPEAAESTWAVLRDLQPPGDTDAPTSPNSPTPATTPGKEGEPG